MSTAEIITEIEKNRIHTFENVRLLFGNEIEDAEDFEIIKNIVNKNKASIIEEMISQNHYDEKIYTLLTSDDVRNVRAELNLTITDKYKEFFERTKEEPIVIMCGGRRSGKTWSILDYLGAKAYFENSLTIQLFSENPKQQEHGLFSDFLDIFKKNPNIYTINNSTKQINFKKKSKISFINIVSNINSKNYAKNLGKADYRFINECDTFERSTFENLLISNKKQFFLDYNPSINFWISDYITENNFIKTTWVDNIKNLTYPQIEEFLRWEAEGRTSTTGSYKWWRWQVYCLGTYAQMTGSIFTTENINFTDFDKFELIKDRIIFIDPSNARGGDCFAIAVLGLYNGQIYLLDSFSNNDIHQNKIIEKIKYFQNKYAAECYIETNGVIGKDIYNKIINANINVNGWYSRNNKFERIMANYETITEKFQIIDNQNNRDYAEQIYTFSEDCKNDDNIDAINNGIMVYKAFGNIF